MVIQDSTGKSQAVDGFRRQALKTMAGAGAVADPYHHFGMINERQAPS